MLLEEVFVVVVVVIGKGAIVGKGAKVGKGVGIVICILLYGLGL